jgi:hypothetical protein
MSKEKMKLVEDYMMNTYKPEMIMSDMVSDVIIHDSYEGYLYRPTEVELNWLICHLRFIVADDQLKEEIKRQDDLDWHNLFYNDKW